jgi:hypothetical protein
MARQLRPIIAIDNDLAWLQYKQSMCTNNLRATTNGHARVQLSLLFQIMLR